MEGEKGYVYILINPAFRENWVKIGKSSRPVNVRSKELDNTAVPLPFEIYATMCTVKYAEAEKLVHKYIERFTNLRIRNNREFFNVKPAEHIFFCTRGGSNAKGYLRESGEFVVLAGSELRSGECESLPPHSIEKRNAFIESQCSQSNEKIILNADNTFPSPSAAAAMVIGGSANGWTEWKDSDGKTLDEVYRKR